MQEMGRARVPENPDTLQVSCVHHGLKTRAKSDCVTEEGVFFHTRIVCFTAWIVVWRLTPVARVSGGYHSSLAVYSLPILCSLRRDRCRHYFISVAERQRMVAWREGKRARAELEVLA